VHSGIFPKEQLETAEEVVEMVGKYLTSLE
jgi:hypothetical protein